jgi:hypothetical protein
VFFGFLLLVLLPLLSLLPLTPLLLLLVFFFFFFFGGGGGELCETKSPCVSQACLDLGILPYQLL